FQAQALIPMATSLAFGLIGSTLLVLLMVPLLYRLYIALTFTDEQMLGFDPAIKERAAEIKASPLVPTSEQAALALDA
ncbi:MAG: hypothetical protein ACKN82_14215, partial [Pirellula sp.]